MPDDQRLVMIKLADEKTELWYDLLRDDPRFTDLRRRMNLIEP